MTNDLLPCPFCGGKAYKKASDVFCENPRCGIYEKRLNDTAWNTRTPNKPAEVDPEVLQALQFLTVGAEDSYDPDHVKVAAKMIKDALSGHLATGKGGGAAPTQIDAGDLELALSSLEPDDVDKAVIYAAARAHLSKLSGGDAQQSDMVAVPREVMEKVKDALANIPRYNKDGLMDFQTTEAWESARKALSMLQPYTKGE